MMVTTYYVDVKITITETVRVQVPAGEGATDREKERDEAKALAVKEVCAMEWGQTQIRDCDARIEVGKATNDGIRSTLSRSR